MFLNNVSVAASVVTDTHTTEVIIWKWVLAQGQVPNLDYPNHLGQLHINLSVQMSRKFR